MDAIIAEVVPPAVLPGGKRLQDPRAGFDIKVLCMISSVHYSEKAGVICSEERGANHTRNQLSRWPTLPPEAFFDQAR